MRVSTTVPLLAVGLTSSLVSAQGALADIPACASSSLINAFSSTTCAPTDQQCLCNDDNVVNSVASAVRDQCSGEDQAKLEAFATMLCPGINLPGVGGSEPEPQPENTEQEEEEWAPLPYDAQVTDAPSPETADTVIETSSITVFSGTATSHVSASQSVLSFTCTRTVTVIVEECSPTPWALESDIFAYDSSASNATTTTIIGNNTYANVSWTGPTVLPTTGAGSVVEPPSLGSARILLTALGTGLMAVVFAEL